MSKIIFLIRHSKRLNRALNRVQLFKGEAPYFNTLPEPVITRWSTRINASNYFSEKIETIRKIFEKLDADGAVSIEENERYTHEVDIEKDLALIKCNYTILTVSITKLRKRELSFAETLNLFGNVEKAFENFRGSTGKYIFNQFNNVLHKTVGLKIKKKYIYISNKLSGTI